jgi:hypothetical protein
MIPKIGPTSKNTKYDLKRRRRFEQMLNPSNILILSIARTKTDSFELGSQAILAFCPFLSVNASRAQ